MSSFWPSSPRWRSVSHVFYKEYAITSFDAGFARSLGMPVQVFHYSLMLSAGLCDCFVPSGGRRSLGFGDAGDSGGRPAFSSPIASGPYADPFGGFRNGSGGSRCVLLVCGRNLPTGPFMVLGGSRGFCRGALFRSASWNRVSLVAPAFALGPHLSRKHAEGHVPCLEDEEFDTDQVSARELAERRRETSEEAHGELDTLRRHQYVTLSSDGDSAFLTPEGWQRACEIVRNHRLWELYLTNAAHIAADHVHEDAEKIEHVLGEETVRMLEKRLNYSRRDPHGRLIPGLEDIQSAGGRHGVTACDRFRKRDESVDRHESSHPYIRLAAGNRAALDG